ncbi:MAG: ABC transporter permease [Vicinamibacterales bacterium]|nr:ABC transporter permease [Vicinamibacterales bacterium]
MRGTALARFAANRAAVVAAGVLVTVTAAAVLAPWLAPHDPLAVDLMNTLAPPSAAHPLGTDHLGRDTLSRLLFGARVSLGIAVTSIGAALVLGVGLGLLAAWHRGLVDAAFVRVMDVLLAFPDLLLAIAVVTILGRSQASTIVAVVVFSLPTLARVTRAAALGAVAHDFVLAARAAGASSRWILARHVLPACLTPIVAQATVMLGSAILLASGLSFLGLGVQPPDPEWGAMLSRGRDMLRAAPLGAVAPGVAITIVALSFSIAGDGLRDALDPKG